MPRHGGTDPGATNGNVREKDLTLAISQYMYEQLRNRGVNTTLIRTSDETLSPTERTNRILEAYGNKSNVIVVSNHINAGTNGTAEGAEVIYALRNNSKLADNILMSLENAGQRVRKVYQRRLPSDTSKDYYFIHRNTGITEPVIVEYGFIDNPEDLARIQNNYRKYVDAVVNAIIATKSGQTINPSTSGTIYVVKSGDSLYSIATRYNTTVNDLKALNKLTNNVLQTGQVLQIPDNNQVAGSNTYTVKSGDSLYAIANKYNTTVNELKSLNNLSSNNLSIGQILKLPVATSSTETTTTTTTPGTNYTVKSGDSLWSIANRYNTTVNNLKSLNNLSSNTLQIGQILKIPTTSSTTQESSNTYTVKSGDTLYALANRYNTTVNEIKSLNNLSSNTLSIGQTLKLPSTTNPNTNIYTVKSGDSLWSIANRYNTTVNDLKQKNNLSSNTLQIGQKLII